MTDRIGMVYSENDTDISLFFRPSVARDEN